MVLPLGDNERTFITPWVTYALIAINVIVFLIQLDRGEEFTAAYAATPFEITHQIDIPDRFILPLPGDEDPLNLPFRRDLGARVVPQAPGPSPIWLTLLTAMFLHGSPMHLAGNMLFLWIFGDNVEEVLGHIKYLVAYLMCGLAASLAQIAANPDSLIPTLGASGAIAGVMGMYLIFFPYNRVRVLFFYFLTEVPAVLVIGLWIGVQVWEGVGSVRQLGEVGGVAYLAHIGGAACGVVTAVLFQDDARRLGFRPLTDDLLG